MININDFISLCRENGLPMTEEAAKKLDLFADYLITENEKYNLTAIKTPEAIMLRHFCDSVTPIPYIQDGAKLLDIGSGAGFPAVPIAVCHESVSVTALDATAKKANFINGAANSLGLSNLTAISGRAEELALDAKYNEKFDFVTARAVSALRILCELSAQYLKVGGHLIALKGERAQTELEIKEAERTALAVGLRLEKTVELSLYDKNTDERLERVLVIMKKVKKTPRSLPRRYAQIVKGSI